MRREEGRRKSTVIMCLPSTHLTLRCQRKCIRREGGKEKRKAESASEDSLRTGDRAWRRSGAELSLSTSTSLHPLPLPSTPIPTDSLSLNMSDSRVIIVTGGSSGPCLHLSPFWPPLIKEAEARLPCSQVSDEQPPLPSPPLRQAGRSRSSWSVGDRPSWTRPSSCARRRAARARSSPSLGTCRARRASRPCSSMSRRSLVSFAVPWEVLNEDDWLTF